MYDNKDSQFALALEWILVCIRVAYYPSNKQIALDDAQCILLAQQTPCTYSHIRNIFGTKGKLMKQTKQDRERFIKELQQAKSLKIDEKTEIDSDILISNWESTFPKRCSNGQYHVSPNKRSDPPIEWVKRLLGDSYVVVSLLHGQKVEVCRIK